jgi:hypothetical protein
MTDQTQALKMARYNMAVYQLALNLYMGATGSVEDWVTGVAQEFDLSIDKVRRDIKVKYRSHFTI